MNIFSRIKAIYEQVSALQKKVSVMEAMMPRLQDALGRLENRQLKMLDSYNLQDNEFQVYSQWGEDGIIQFLIRHIPIVQKTFIEFGVENYRESNTRFLLQSNNWTGLVMDGDPAHVAAIRKSNLYWRHSLTAVESFITCENINALIQENGFSGEIGLLSVDIDGNDYWVWQAIDAVSPAIVVVEYNYRFGPHRAVTIPYRADFQRNRAHHSNIYYGASLKALCLLGERKGYDFVGSNSAGNNAFFVRRDLRPDAIPKLTAEEGYIQARFRESRDRSGRLSFISFEEEQRLLAELELIDVESELYAQC